MLELKETNTAIVRLEIRILEFVSHIKDLGFKSLVGTYTTSIDEKKRTTLPAGFRKKLACIDKEIKLLPILILIKPLYVVLIPFVESIQDAYEKEEWDRLDPEMKNLFIRSQGDCMKIDKQGRTIALGGYKIGIAESYITPGKEIIWVGLDKVLEIRDISYKERFLASKELTEEPDRKDPAMKDRILDDERRLVQSNILKIGDIKKIPNGK